MWPVLNYFKMLEYKLSLKVQCLTTICKRFKSYSILILNYYSGKVVRDFSDTTVTTYCRNLKLTVDLNKIFVFHGFHNNYCSILVTSVGTILNNKIYRQQYI